MEKGYRQVTAKADPFLDMLRHGNAVISAFKTHRMQNDMAARLLDKDGKLKPFRTWMRDVKDIASHYTVRWLRTEYDTAVLRAHEAAAWRQARQEADVLPNLRWMPTTSASPDVIHKAFWSMRLTLPVNHPFWKKHRPQDRWGCKCSIMQTDEPVTELKGLGKADRIKPVPGLDNNPADDGMVFGKSHPNITKAYPGAEKATANILRKELSEWAKQNLPNVKVGKMDAKRFEVDTPGKDYKTVINRNFYEEVASKYKDSPLYAERLFYARHAHKLFPKASYKGSEKPEDHKDATSFEVYEYKIDGKTLVFKCRINREGSFLYYMRIL